ncbi:MAG: Gfo/Idh/MocA family oxidoreductase [Phycisphaeraceae bacterium]|nr:Gfo/Idh/MocA family oxidoreductase [Phycisphaeraceae bacterium]
MVQVTSPLSISLIGCGEAAQMIALALKANARATINRVVGRDPLRTMAFAQEHGISGISTSLNEALNRDTELVIIATPTYLHYDQAKAALQAGKHVIVEVPLSLSGTHADHLKQFARDNGCLLATLHVSRGVTVMRRAYELIQSGAIGQPLQFLFRRLMWKHREGGMGGRQREWDDSITWHHAAHAIDLVNWWTDSRVKYSAASIQIRTATQNDVGFLALANTGVATVSLSMAYYSQHAAHDWVITGDRGAIEITGYLRLCCNGIVVCQNDSELDELRQAYRRYLNQVIDQYLRVGVDQSDIDAAVMPMSQIQTIHDCATRIPINY